MNECSGKGRSSHLLREDYEATEDWTGMLFLSVFTAEPGVEHALKVLLRHNLSFDRWKGIRKSQRLAGGGSVRFSQLLGSRT